MLLPGRGRAESSQQPAWVPSWGRASPPDLAQWGRLGSVSGRQCGGTLQSAVLLSLSPSRRANTSLSSALNQPQVSLPSLTDNL